MIRLKDDELN